MLATVQRIQSHRQNPGKKLHWMCVHWNNRSFLRINALGFFYHTSLVSLIQDAINMMNSFVYTVSAVSNITIILLFGSTIVVDALSHMISIRHLIVRHFTLMSNCVALQMRQSKRSVSSEFSHCISLRKSR